MRLPPRGVLAAALLIGAVAMGPSLGNGFVYDDVPIVATNPHVTGPTSVGTIVGSTYWLGRLWRPVTIAGFAVEWHLGGGRPWVFHATSILVYLLLGLLVWSLLRGLAIPPGPAGLVLAAWLVHPVHVEAVANVVGQSELWMTLAMTGAVLLYLRLRTHGYSPQLLLALLAVMTVGMLAKEQGFVIIAILAALEGTLLRDRGDRAHDRVRVLLPAAALTLLLFFVRAGITGSLAGETPATALGGLGLGARTVAFLAVVPQYVRLMLWPWHLQADYSAPHLPVGGPWTAQHALGIGCLVVAVALGLRVRKRAPVAEFGLWWLVITLAPVSNLLVPTGIQLAERVLFAPSLGVAIAVAGSLPLFELDRGVVRRGVGAALAGYWILMATAVSFDRTQVWHDPATFFTRLPKDASRDYRAALVSARYWRGVDSLAQAEADFRQALRLWPHDAAIQEDLGQLLRAEGRCQDAVPVLRSGLEAEPLRTAVRAKLFECLLKVGDSTAALRVADEGIALGDSSFVAVRHRAEGSSHD